MASERDNGLKNMHRLFSTLWNKQGIAVKWMGESSYSPVGLSSRSLVGSEQKFPMLFLNWALPMWWRAGMGFGLHFLWSILLCSGSAVTPGTRHLCSEQQSLGKLLVDWTKDLHVGTGHVLVRLVLLVRPPESSICGDWYRQHSVWIILVWGWAQPCL